MPRQLRIEYAEAFYHVYSRGNQKQPIFFSDKDRYFFLKTLKDAHDRLELIVHLYCLMNNHYHLTLETPAGNLSRIMHFVNSAFSIHQNTQHKRCGHLFQGRFKAVLVQADRYARILAVYIHGNPVRNGIVNRPELYPWSSCRYYYGLRKPPAWMDTRVIMSAFGNSVRTLKAEHERYLGIAGDPSFKDELEKAARIGILGDDDFVDRIRRSLIKNRLDNPDGELRELRRLRVRPELTLIMAELNGELGGRNKLSKKCTIYLAHKYADYKLKEIGVFLGLSPAAVSASYSKISSQIASNETLRRIIEQVRSRLNSFGGGP